MTKPKTLIMKIPFPGFYNSIYSAAIDHEESQWCEYRCDDEDESQDAERQWPEPVRFDESDLAEFLIRSTEYRDAERKIAAWYIEAFDLMAGEALGLSVKATRKRYDWEAKETRTESYQRPSIRLEFETMDSPREYNFSTDRIYAYVPVSMARELFRRSKADDHATLRAVIKDRFTSYDGFISGYTTDLGAWLAKPLTDWDHNQLETLLMAVLQIAGVDHDSDETRAELYDSTFSDEGAYQAWESAVDWQKFERLRMEARAEKLADWVEADAEAFGHWRAHNRDACDSIIAAAPELFRGADLELGALPYRCPLTPDMFDEGARQ